MLKKFCHREHDVRPWTVLKAVIWTKTLTTRRLNEKKKKNPKNHLYKHARAHTHTHTHTVTYKDHLRLEACLDQMAKHLKAKLQAVTTVAYLQA